MCAAAMWARTYMSRQVFPQAPSPTITSFRRISAMAKTGVRAVGGVVAVLGVCCGNRRVSRGDGEEVWLK